jgi:hypothetical protein
MSKQQRRQRAEAFARDVERLCKAHHITFDHEDHHGNFVLILDPEEYEGAGFNGCPLTVGRYSNREWEYPEDASF